MGFTTGQTAIQMVTMLQSHGANAFDQAAGLIYNLAWTKNSPQVLFGVLCQCTTGWNDGDPRFEYDVTPSAGSTAQSVAQAAATLVTAGALQDQALQVLHSLAWYPNTSKTLWGVLVKCTTGWNGGNPQFSVNSSPS